VSLALKQLLSSIVDYAGLFPPAQRSLPEAIALYNQAQCAPEQWLIGRFVLPAACLPAFLTLRPTGLKPERAERWPLSIILSHNWAIELAQIREHATTHSVHISALEMPPLPPDTVRQIGLHLPMGTTAFFEIPLNADLDPYLTVLQQPHIAAKLRTGGITSDAFPDSAQLAQAILSLAKANIPFKATAGLHHPLRGDRRLTYNPDSAFTTMHGFLNVAMLAAAAYQQSVSLDDAIALLEEQSIHAFGFIETSIHWRNYALSLAALERSRQQFFHSFGSCSIQEPIDDLHSLRLL